jgi:hypothetical protein
MTIRSGLSWLLVVGSASALLTPTAAAAAQPAASFAAPNSSAAAAVDFVRASLGAASTDPPPQGPALAMLGESLSGPTLAAADPDPAAAGSLLTPIAPARIYDSRSVAPVEGAVPVEIPIAGRAAVPASGVGAVSLNVTIVDPVAIGYATVYPCGEQPLASNLNYIARQTVPNAVLATLSPAGSICVLSTARTHLVIDANGWFEAGAGYNPQAPNRILDTRNGNGAPVGRAAAGSIVTLQVAGRGGVPASGAAAVSLNLTVEAPAAAGYVSAFPCGQQSLVSNLNYGRGQTIPNAVVVPIAADGTACLFTTAATHAIADVNGWFSTGSGFSPLTPTRVLDTRQNPLPRPCAAFSGTDTSGDSAAHDIVEFAALNDCTSWSFAAVSRDAVPDTAIELVAWLDTDGNASNGCGGYEAVAIGFFASDLGRLAAGVVRTPTCATSRWTFLGEGGIARNKQTQVAMAFPASFIGNPKLLMWSVGLSTKTSTTVDYAPNDGAVISSRLRSNKIPAEDFYELTMAGAGGVPTTGARAVWLNATVTEAEGDGFATVYPCGQNPSSSNLNFRPGVDVANAVLAPIEVDGKICIYSSHDTHVVVDVAGWFS